MPDKYEEILKKDSFKNISPEIKNSLKLLMNQLQGKSIVECMAIIVKFTKSMPKGKPLSKQELDAMKSAIFEGLEGEEKEKFQKIIKMTEMMG